MRLFQQKKGQEELTLPPAFLIAIGLGIVLLTILYAAMSIARNEAYDRQLAVNNIGLDMQALQSFGKDINADRIITDAGPYMLVFESGKVYTRERGVPTSTFLFTQAPGYVFHGGEFLVEKGKKTIGPLTLFLRGNKFGAAQPANLPSVYTLVCDGPAGTPLTSIAIDPSKGYDGTIGDQGYDIASTSTKESTYTMNLARSFSIASGMTVNPTRALDRDSIASIDARQKTAGDALVSFNAGMRADDQEVVKAYYNPKSPYGRKLACEILNGIVNEFNIPVRPIPVDVDRLPADDAKLVLKGSRPAVYLEIGNARKIKSILKDTSILANAIFKGVKKYGVA
jgi:hypothetical protein